MTEEAAPVGGIIDDLLVAKARAAARQLIVESFTPEHAGKSMANLIAGLRKAAGTLPLFAQAWAGHLLDGIDLLAADPETEAAVATWLQGIVLPLLDPPA